MCDGHPAPEHQVAQEAGRERMQNLARNTRQSPQEIWDAVVGSPPYCDSKGDPSRSIPKQNASSCHGERFVHLANETVKKNFTNLHIKSVNLLKDPIYMLVCGLIAYNSPSVTSFSPSKADVFGSIAIES